MYEVLSLQRAAPRPCDGACFTALANKCTRWTLRFLRPSGLLLYTESIFTQRRLHIQQGQAPFLFVCQGTSLISELHDISTNRRSEEKHIPDMWSNNCLWIYSLFLGFVHDYTHKTRPWKHESQKLIIRSQCGQQQNGTSWTFLFDFSIFLTFDLWPQNHNLQ